MAATLAAIAGKQGQAIVDDIIFAGAGLNISLKTVSGREIRASIPSQSGQGHIALGKDVSLSTLGPLAFF